MLYTVKACLKYNCLLLSSLYSTSSLQVNGLTTQLRTLQVKIQNMKGDNAAKQREIARVELELGPLKQKASLKINLQIVYFETASNITV